jgi:hypothetical protein
MIQKKGSFSTQKTIKRFKISSTLETILSQLKEDIMISQNTYFYHQYVLIV